MAFFLRKNKEVKTSAPAWGSRIFPSEKQGGLYVKAYVKTG